LTNVLKNCNLNIYFSQYYEFIKREFKIEVIKAFKKKKAYLFKCWIIKPCSEIVVIKYEIKQQNGNYTTLDQHI